MPITEDQLSTWSHQGSIQQSAATYQAIRNVLSDPSSPFSKRTYEIFLQGSYGNDTNIYADSDVDIGICLTSTYYTDTRWLNETEKANYQNNFCAADYQLSDFKKEVMEWLRKKFGETVKAGNKAIRIPASAGRRDADVLVCAENRQYTSYPRSGAPTYHRGITFWTQSGQQIVNYPHQHKTNCSRKHQATQARFKPNIRVLKNVRNSMISKGYLVKGKAPSYFLEGLLYNVPDHLFGYRFSDTLIAWYNWTETCVENNLMCANNIHYLLREGHSVCWSSTDYREFKLALKRFWEDY